MKKKMFYGILILCVLVAVTRSFAQGVQDTVRVHIEEISISDTTPFRGFAPAFPFPVMTKLTVVDDEGNFIVGLADTAKWLGPMDVAEIGSPVAKIWQPLLEYHRDNPDYPDNQDFLKQVFEPRITEVREDQNTPATTILVMDMSSSMENEVDEVKAGAQQYVEGLRDVDRTGIILFNREVSGILPITGNKDSLLNFIDNAELGNGTAIYDGLMAAVDIIKHENVRPRIIVYTDGADHNSRFTPEAVIDSAMVYKIPIFTIALGNGAYETDLRKIAGETGGLFFKAESASQMQELYTKLSALIRNFYVMVHFSSDPTWNDSWRTVDVTLDAPGYYGHGTGDYYVKGLTDENRTDMTVDLTAITEMVTFEEGDSIHWVQAGEQFNYILRVINTGPNRANYVRVTQTIPDYINILDASIDPVDPDSTTLTWHFMNMNTGEEEIIHLTAELSADVPRGVVSLESRTNMIADTDDQLDNNFDGATVFVFHPSPPKDFELSLTQQVTTDTSVIVNNQTRPAVWSGGTFEQRLLLKNDGPATAYDISLSGVLTSELNPQNLDLTGGFVRNDTLFWQTDSLPASDSLEIVFKLQVAEFIPYDFYPLISSFQVTAENDLSSANNTAQSRVIGLKKKLHDVTVQQFISTDSMEIVGGDTVWFAKPSEKYDYKIIVSNVGPDTAFNVVLRDVFPDSVVISDILPFANIANRIYLEWSMGALLPFSQRSIQFSATVAAEMPVGSNPLVNRVFVSSDEEAPDKSGNNSSIDTVYTVVEAPRVFELALSQRVVTDTTVEFNGAFEPAVWSGREFEQFLILKNAGPETAYDISLWGLLADALSPQNLELSGGIIRNDTLFWQIDSLPAADSLEITFPARVSSAIPYDYYPLENSFQVAAQNDLSAENNTVQSRVIALKRPLPLVADVAVEQFIFADSFNVVGSDSIWLVEPGEKYFYTVVVSNVSQDTAVNVVLRDFLPDSIAISEFEPPANDVTSDSVRWSFDMLPPFSQKSFRFAVTVAPRLPTGYNFLINRAMVSADNEAPDKLANNVAADTVYSVVLPVDDFLPRIEAQPHNVEVGEPVTVRVAVEVPVRTWDIWVYFENGEIDSTFADDFILANPLPTGSWVPIPQPYTNTRLVTDSEQEELVFEVRVLDISGLTNTARSSVTVESTNDFNLDRNVFAAAREPDLDINFKLSSNRIARLELYDVAGTRITRIAEQPFNAGWNTYTWNGMTESGQKVGSGVYLVILRSGGFSSWKKLIVVQ